MLATICTAGHEVAIAHSSGDTSMSGSTRRPCAGPPFMRGITGHSVAGTLIRYALGADGYDERALLTRGHTLEAATLPGLCANVGELFDAE
jgi:hypothetical protein